MVEYDNGVWEFDLKLLVCFDKFSIRFIIMVEIKSIKLIMVDIELV